MLTECAEPTLTASDQQIEATCTECGGHFTPEAADATNSFLCRCPSPTRTSPRPVLTRLRPIPILTHPRYTCPKCRAENVCGGRYQCCACSETVTMRYDSSRC